jgi:hypothetical protein
MSLPSAMASVASVLPALATLRSRRLAGRLVVALAALAVLAPSPASAQPVDFALSVPSEPLVGRPGEEVGGWVGFSNGTEDQLRLTLRLITLETDDEGKLFVVDQPDPAWLGHVSFPNAVEIQPRGYEQARVTIRIPESARSDLYFLGFLAESPTASNPGEVAVRSQVSNFLVVSVPGERDQKMALLWHRLPRVVIGRSLVGHFRVANAGQATAAFRGQVWVDSPLRSRNLEVVQATGERMQLLPPGRTRTFRYDSELRGFPLFVRPTLEIAYPGAGTETLQEKGPLVLVLPPEAVVLAAITLLTVTSLGLYRFRRRLARFRDWQQLSRA